MASVTVRDMLALLQRFGARLVAGAPGLERPVTWACTARASPPAYAELRGGELALLSLGTLAALHAQDNTLTLARLIQHLNERGVAAIAVAGLLALDKDSTAPASAVVVPASGASVGARLANEDEIRLATALRLPLVSLPASAPLPDVERELIAAVARPAVPDSATDAPGMPRAIYDLLVHDSLRGSDDRALGERLAGLTGAAVALGDAREIRWCALPPGYPVAREALLNLLRRPSARAQMRALIEGFAPPAMNAVDAPPGATPRAHGAAPAVTVAEMPLGAGWRWLAAPLWVRAGETLLLALVVPTTTSQPGDGDATAATMLDATLALVAPLFALSVARQRDLDSSRATVRAETLDALLAGTYADEERMRARAAQLGYDLAHPHIALVVDLTPQPPSPRGKGEPDAAALVHRSGDGVGVGGCLWFPSPRRGGVG